MGKIAIILAAKDLTSESSNVFNVSSPCLVPYKGKPLISWNISNLIQHDINNIIVATSNADSKLKQIINKYKRYNIELVTLPYLINEGPGNTLLKVLYQKYNVLKNQTIFILNGDCYFEWNKTSFQDQTIVFTIPYFESDKHTVIYTDQNGQVQYYSIKHGSLPQTPIARKIVDHHQLIKESFFSTEVGLYHTHFKSDQNTLQKMLKQQVYLSTMDILFKLNTNIKQHEVTQWTDLENLISSNQKHLSPRLFNKLTISPTGTIIKNSANNFKKIINEINYYRSLPKEIQVLFPRLIKYNINKSQANYELDMYPMKTLSEYLVFWNLPQRKWKEIIDKLFYYLNLFSRYKQKCDHQKLTNFYLEKTINRIKDIKNQQILQLLKQEYVIVNSQKLLMGKKLLDTAQSTLAKLEKIKYLTAIHGDLCFANILVDPNNGIVKLIDPKGSFIQEDYFGDPRYDLAKLMHSTDGQYDYIIHDMFQLEKIKENKFYFSIFSETHAHWVRDYIYQKIKATKYRPADVTAIEGSLFLTMIPLHSDQPLRQLAFLLIASQLFTNIQKGFDEN